LCPPLQNPNPSSDFPEPNVHLIKARLNPFPSIQNTSFFLHPYFIRPVLFIHFFLHSSFILPSFFLNSSFIIPSFFLFRYHENDSKV
jgi:hypothetical protein